MQLITLQEFEQAAQPYLPLAMCVDHWGARLFIRKFWLKGDDDSTDQQNPASSSATTTTSSSSPEVEAAVASPSPSLSSSSSSSVEAAAAPSSSSSVTAAAAAQVVTGNASITVGQQAERRRQPLLPLPDVAHTDDEEEQQQPRPTAKGQRRTASDARTRATAFSSCRGAVAPENEHAFDELSCAEKDTESCTEKNAEGCKVREGDGDGDGDKGDGDKRNDDKRDDDAGDDGRVPGSLSQMLHSSRCPLSARQFNDGEPSRENILHVQTQASVQRLRSFAYCHLGLAAQPINCAHLLAHVDYLYARVSAIPMSKVESMDCFGGQVPKSLAVRA
ncbi:hypothetical protein BDB00DRAFT_872791 [Zychaea mexicana]|uniref:uncharacterized protein n=1 Tax=Zychaea mexicana TaxID=64656 RepID=UPI0022FEC2FC|nr:uncharacterized protein BDB00DRAFT_872791 [Zychaea mexicana]KAI9493072.1 hypothetical protein BDB00DRAFT_872791 [Zychaea mexicana]